MHKMAADEVSRQRKEKSW
uniref:Uncharacterized protein n=1 Tax=Anguilla anguilla TaxID=7936 RepID=A0A0E9VWC6_ANGAN